MKKFKTLIACLILLCSCVIFASCSKGDEKVEFEETSPIVLEVGETYSPKVSVSPEKYLADVILSTSDSRVVVISPDNELVAVGVGKAQVEAKLKDATANLVVEVVEKRTKLQTPSGFFYQCATNRIVWSQVNNANSYDVEIDGDIVAKNLTTNFYEINSSQTKSVRIKANGIGKYSDSDFTDAYKFKNLPSPTDLKFDKNTQTLSWEYSENAQFRVCVNKILLDVVNTNSCVLPLENAGVYDVCVVAVAETNQKDGDTFVFDSLRSESLEITRLGGVDKNSIVWNASESLLTWGEVKGAKYRVQIGAQTPVEAQTNNLTIQNLEKGNYEIKITAISDQPLVLDAKDAATSHVAITKQLQTPVIESFDEGTNTLTLVDFGEAQNFQILCNGVEIYSGDAVISDSKAKLTLPSRVFDEAGEYSLTAISKTDEARFYTQSAMSANFVITRLAAPTSLRIENGRTLAFGTLPQATFGYVVFVAGAEHTLSEATYDLFDISPNTYEVKVKYLGNKNNILESANASITITKLLAPVLEFDKETKTLSINNLPSGQGFDISINSSVQKNVTLSQNNEYSLSGMLAVGENRVTVQALAKQNEVLSDIVEIHVYQLEEIQNLTHESINDVSYIKLLKNAKYDSFVITLDGQVLDHTTSNDDDTTILVLNKKTSEIFVTAGDYSIKVEAKSSDDTTINPSSVSLNITKLPVPTNFAYVSPNSFVWANQTELSNNFKLQIFDESDNLKYDLSTNDTTFVVEDLVLGNLKAKVGVVGNEKDILSSDYCSMLTLVHTKTLSEPVVGFDKQNERINIQIPDSDTTKVKIFVNDEEKDSFEYSSSIVYPLGTDFDEAGEYVVEVQVINETNEFILGNRSQELVLTRLQAPADISFSGEILSWSQVDGANEYSIMMNENEYSSSTPRFSTSEFEPSAYVAQIVAKSNEQTVLDSASATYEFDVRRILATPANLAYNKGTNSLSFDEVRFAEKYEIYINQTLLVETQTTTFKFNGDQFKTPQNYNIQVRAISNDEYRTQSNLSRALVVTRLAAPTQINISADEIVSCLYDVNTTESVKILVNDTDTNSLATFDGEIKIKAKFIGKTDNYLDSDYGEFERTRLLSINNLRVENDKIMWDENAYVEGYLFSLLYDDDTIPYEVTLEKDVTEREFEFERIGAYTLTMTALGNKTVYLDSRTTSIQISKLACPTNLSLVEIWETVEDEEKSSIKLTFESEETDILGYEIFVDGQSIGIHTEKEKQISSSVFSAVGQHTVYVVAIGDNSKNAISSNQSEGFETYRLAAPDSFGTASNYYVVWNAVHSQTEYGVKVSHGEGESEKIIKQDTTASTLIYFEEEAMSDEFVDLEGTINVSVCSLGNNTTLLRSLTIMLAVPKTPKTELSSDADKVYFSKVDSSSYFEVTILLNGDTTNPIVENGYLYGTELEIPTNWDVGEYTFIVRQIKGGEFISGYTTFVKNKLPNVDSTSCAISRSEDDEDILILSWDEVENASGYIVKYSNSLNSYDSVELYRGTDNKFALPDDLASGQVFFWIQAMGSAEHGFSSNLVFFNRTKLSSDALYVRNENGILTWNLEGTAICEGYKIVINGDKENAIKLDGAVSSYDLKGFSGQLNIRIKAIGKDFGIDSNYAELNIVKLPTPTNVRVVEGEIRWDFGYTLGEGETVNFIYNIGGMQFDATTEGIANLTAMLLANKEYKATVQALNTEIFLTSDQSSEIVVKLLENPNSNDGSTNISTNSDKTISSFNWSSASGAKKYEVKVEGEKLSEPQLRMLTDTTWTISGLDSGDYQIYVRRIGETGAIDGVNYLSSGFSSPISFTVLSAPIVTVLNGELAWLSQVGANNYYLYVGDSYKPCGNVNRWTFLDEYKDWTKETDISLFMQAIGDGVEYIASAKTSEIKVVKPRPPQMLVVKNGALCWGDLEAYTYYEDTQNKNIYLDFVQNETTVESFEIDINLMKSGWPLDDNYLQKLTSNLPAGEYLLKIKQIGDNTKVITSEYSEQSFTVVVAPTVENVRVDEHKLLWDEVTLENYNETNETVYVIYAFDSEKNDWVKLAETNSNSLNIENSDGLLKPQHIALAVATKGNTTSDGFTNFVTGNMSDKVDIIVLGSTSDLQTVDGNLTWGIVANAVQYRVQYENGENMVVSGGVQSSYLSGLQSGVHQIKIRALGNGTTKNGACIINGVWGQASTFTKLEKPVASTKTDSENKLEWGSFRWAEISFANGYNVYVNNNMYAYINNNIYESDYAGTDTNLYQFQARGNSVTPSTANIAYISSDLSNGLSRARMAKITGVMVQDGKLYWNRSSSSSTYYFVDFYQDGERVERVVASEKTVQIDGVSKVEFDVAGFVQEGSFTVYVRSTINSDTYISGVESDSIEISKLDAPNNVRLEYGILTWDNVDDATGYVINLVSNGTTTQIVEGFAYDFATNSWHWTSTFNSRDVFYVSLRAVSTEENKLNSSWTTKNGVLQGNESNWQVRQIAAITLRQINVGAGNEDIVTWSYGDDLTNVPASRAYQVWRKGEETFIASPVTTNSYPIDVNLTGISIRTIPYGENEYDYFASTFSEFKDVEKPEPPQDLTYDSTRQIFTWSAAGTSDASYVVYYTIDGGDEIVFETEDNKFEPSIPGDYVVCVQVKKSESIIGKSNKSEPVEGVFDLFTTGYGTKENPFEVDSTNFNNIMFRPNAHFILMSNITRNNVAPLGSNGSKAATPFLGSLNGNNKTITMTLAQNQNSTYVGLFAELGSGAQVKDLNIVIEGDIVLSNTSSSAIHAGAIAGRMVGAETLVENCTVSGNVTLYRYRDSETRFGSIVGLLETGVIKNCTSSLNIVSSTNYFSKVGGIVGIVGTNSSTDAIVDSCQNSGSIMGANIAGGIAAWNYGTIKNSKNTASITSEIFYSYDANGKNEIVCESIAGGIVGQNQGSSTGDGVVGGIVQNCENQGAILANNSTSEAKKANSYAGGIVGWTKNGLIDGNYGMAKAEISKTNNSTTKAAGAVVGHFDAYSGTSTNYYLTGLANDEIHSSCSLVAVKSDKSEA